MSTQALINIEGVNYLTLYKHWDGYPSATYQFLKEFNKDFEETRPGDPEYKAAQLLRASMKEGLDHGWDPSRYTGWGLVPYTTEGPYVYTLTLDGTVLINGLTEYHAIKEYGDLGSEI